MQKDSTRAKIWSKVVGGGLLFYSPCIYATVNSVGWDLFLTQLSDVGYGSTYAIMSVVQVAVHTIILVVVTRHGSMHASPPKMLSRHF